MTKIEIWEDEISISGLTSNDIDTYNKFKCIKDLMLVFDSFYAKHDRYPSDFEDVILHFRQNDFHQFRDLRKDYTGEY